MTSLSITPAAAAFVRRMLRMSGAEHGGFRLVVSPGGCSGLNSEFSVEGAPRQGDAVVDVDGFRLFLPPASALLLDGAVMDFVDSAVATGLVFQTRGGSCACSDADATPAPAAVALDALTTRRAPGREC